MGRGLRRCLLLGLPIFASKYVYTDGICQWNSIYLLVSTPFYLVTEFPSFKVQCGKVSGKPTNEILFI